MKLDQLLPPSFFQRCEASFIGSAIQGSKYSFATIETIHIMALAVLLGSFLIVDLRLFGLGMRSQTVGEVASQFAVTSWVSFLIMVATGIPMYLSEAIKLSHSSAFFYKMVFLCLALLLHVTVHRRVTRPNSTSGPGLARIAAGLSMISWLAVALAGRAIAFL